MIALYKSQISSRRCQTQQSRMMSRLSTWTAVGAMSGALAGLVGYAIRAGWLPMLHPDGAQEVGELSRMISSCAVVVGIYYDGLMS